MKLNYNARDAVQIAFLLAVPMGTATFIGWSWGSEFAAQNVSDNVASWVIDCYNAATANGTLLPPANMTWPAYANATTIGVSLCVAAKDAAIKSSDRLVGLLSGLGVGTLFGGGMVLRKVRDDLRKQAESGESASLLSSGSVNSSPSPSV